MAQKLPECDREAARLLAIQQKNAPASRKLDVLLCALFVGVIALFSLLHVLLPDREKSETENRTLEQLPEFSAESLLDGKFTADIADYMADQFPGRDFFITLKSGMETVLGKKVNNGVIFGDEGTLVSRDDLPNLENLADNLDATDAFSAWCADRGIPSLMAITGRTADVLDHTLPSYYGSEYSDRLWAELEKGAADRSYAFLNLRNPLRTKAAGGEYVYYRTDHHWTTFGAYCGYAEIAAAWGTEPTPLADYTRETVSENFLGTTWSTAGASWIAGDTMEFFRFAGDEEYTVTVTDSGVSFAGFYDRSYLEVKDKYSAFLSGNHGLVTVTENDPATERETLLLIKDSFAHAAAPFLARHYDLVIVDLRYYKMRVTDLVEQYGVDRVLYLMNVDSLTGSTVLRMLQAGT